MPESAIGAMFEPKDAPTDDEQVARVQGGVRRAFVTIVNRHQREVWRIVARMLGDRRATENLVQQTFVNLYTGLGGYQPGNGLRHWLRTIARNAVRDELRRTSRENRLYA